MRVYSGSVGQVNQYDLMIGDPNLELGEISGFKFHDYNIDGLQDEERAGVGRLDHST